MAPALFKEYVESARECQPRVLLISPLHTSETNANRSHIGYHRPRQPLGLAYVSSFLKQLTTTQLVDAAVLCWDAAATIEFIQQVAPDVLVISSASLDRWQNPPLDLSNMFAIVNQSNIARTIVVGPHGTVTPDWILEQCQADFVVRGEPEFTCRALVEAFLKSRTDFSGIAGLSYRDGAQVRHNSDRVFDSDLDSYPFPDYESLPMSLYRYTIPDIPQPTSLILSSRGCPSRCAFCLTKMMPGKYRARSAENVLQEITYLVNGFGIRGIYSRIGSSWLIADGFNASASYWWTPIIISLGDVVLELPVRPLNSLH